MLFVGEASPAKNGEKSSPGMSQMELGELNTKTDLHIVGQVIALLFFHQADSDTSDVSHF